MAASGAALAGHIEPEITNVIVLLANEQEQVQKRTFTKWVNSHLARHEQPCQVDDLFQDLRDGTKLLLLLETLSDETLNREKGRNLKRIHFLSNINTALRFLEKKGLRLVNTNGSDIADGNPSITLGLVWKIILYFEIEQNAKALEQDLLSISTDSASTESSPFTSPPDSRRGSGTFSPPPPTKKPSKTRPAKVTAKNALLTWTKNALKPKPGTDKATQQIQVKDFGPSWRDGHAFNLLIHNIREDLVDLERLPERSNSENLDNAFTVAEKELGIMKLLEPKDVDVDKPDEKSIMTYVSQFFKAFPETGSHKKKSLAMSEGDAEKNLVEEVTDFLAKADAMIQIAKEKKKSQQDEYWQFVEFQSEHNKARKLMTVIMQKRQKKVLITLNKEECQIIIERWTKISQQYSEWRKSIEETFPGKLKEIADWLNKAEDLVASEVQPSNIEEETLSIVRRRCVEHEEHFKEGPNVQRSLTHIRQTNPKTGPTVIPDEILIEMHQRLQLVLPAADKKLQKLHYLEHKYRLLAFAVMAEKKLETWTVKYGTKEEMNKLVDNYENFVTKADFFTEFDHHLREFHNNTKTFSSQASDEDRQEAVNFEQEMLKKKEYLRVEIEGVRPAMERIIETWKSYETALTSLQSWLDGAEKVLNEGTPEQKVKYFTVLLEYSEQVKLFNVGGTTLTQACRDDVSYTVNHQVSLINDRWNDVFERGKVYVQDLNATRRQQDFRDKLKKLQTWTSEVHIFLSDPVECTTPDLSRYQQQLVNMEKDIPSQERTFKELAQLAQEVARESSPDQASEMVDALKEIKEPLAEARSEIPNRSANVNKVLAAMQQLDTKTKDIDEVLAEEELLLSTRVNDLNKSDEEVQRTRQQCQVSKSRLKKVQVPVEEKNQLVKYIVSLKSTYIHTTVVESNSKKIDDRLQKCLADSEVWDKTLISVTDFQNKEKEIEDLLSDSGDISTILADPNLLTSYEESCGHLLEDEDTPPAERAQIEERMTKMRANVEDWRSLWKQYQEEKSSLKMLLDRISGHLEVRHHPLSAQEVRDQLHRMEVSQRALSKLEKVQDSLTVLSQRMQEKCKGRTKVFLKEDLNDVTLRFQTISSQVVTVLKEVKELEPKWMDFEETKQSASHTLDEMDKRLENLESTQGNPEDAMKKLKELVDAIDNQQGSLECLNFVLSDLCNASTSLDDPNCELFPLHEKWKELKRRTNDVNTKLKEGASLWGLYNTALCDLRRWLEKSEEGLKHELESCDSLEETQKCSKNVEALQHERREKEPVLREVLEIAPQLYPRDAIQSEVTDLQKRVDAFDVNLAKGKNHLDDVETSWKKYQIDGDSFNAWCEREEIGLEEMMNSSDKSTKTQKQNLEKLKNLQDVTKEKDSTLEDLTTQAEALGQSCSRTGVEKLQNDCMERQRRLNGLLQKMKDFLRQCIDDLHLSLREIEESQKRLAESFSLLDVTGDKDTCEQKLKAIQDVQTQKDELQEDLSAAEDAIRHLIPFLPSEMEKTLDAQGDTLHSNLDQLNTDLKNIEDALKERTREWSDLEDTARSFRQWMEEMDGRLSLAAELRQDLPAKIEQDKVAKTLLQEIQQGYGTLDHLERTSKELSAGNTTDVQDQLESRMSQLRSQYQMLVERSEDVHQSQEKSVSDFNNYLSSMETFSHLLESLNMEFASLEDEEEQGEVAVEAKVKKVKELIEKIPDGNRLLQSTESAGAIAINSTASSGHAPIQERMKIIESQWQEIKDKLVLEESNLKERERLKNQVESLVAEFEIWLESAESQEKDLEAKRDNTKEKMEALGPCQVLYDDVQKKANLLDEILEKSRKLGKDWDKSRIQRLDDSYQDLSDGSQACCERIKEAIENNELLDQQLRDLTEDVARCEQLAENNSRVDVPLKDINVQLQVLQDLKNLLPEMEEKLERAKSQADKVKPETSDSGQALIQDNIERLQDSLKQLLDNVESNINQLNSCLQTQSGLEVECKVLSDWLGNSEPILKTAEVPCDDIQGKETAKLAVEDLLNTVPPVQDKSKRLTDEINELVSASKIDPEQASSLLDLCRRVNEMCDITQEMSSTLGQQLEEHQHLDSLSEKLSAWFEEKTEEYETCRDCRELLDENREIVEKLEELLRSHPDGDALFAEMETRAERVLLHTSPRGQETIRENIKTLAEKLAALKEDTTFTTHKTQKLVSLWEALVSSVETAEEELGSIEHSLEEVKGPYQDESALGHAFDEIQMLKSDVNQLEARLSDIKSIKESITDIAGPIKVIADRNDKLNQMHHDSITKVQEEHDHIQRGLSDANLYKLAKEEFWTWLEETKSSVREISEMKGSKETLSSKMDKLQKFQSCHYHGEHLIEVTETNAAKLTAYLTETGKETVDTEVSRMKTSLSSLLEDILSSKDRIESKLREIDHFEAKANSLDKRLDGIKSNLVAGKELQSGLPEKKTQLEKCKSLQEELMSSSLSENLENLKDMASALQEENLDLSELQDIVDKLQNQYEEADNFAQEAVEIQRNAVMTHQVCLDAYQSLEEQVKVEEDKLKDSTSLNGQREDVQGRIERVQEILTRLTDCHKNLTEFERLSQDACRFSSPPGREAIDLLYNNLMTTVDGVQKHSEVTLEGLQHCLRLWSDFERDAEMLKTWLDEMEKRIDATSKVTKGKLESLEMRVDVIQSLVNEIDAFRSKPEEVRSLSEALFEADEGNLTAVTEANKLQRRYDDLSPHLEEVLGNVTGNISKQKALKQKLQSAEQTLHDIGELLEPLVQRQVALEESALPTEVTRATQETVPLIPEGEVCTTSQDDALEQTSHVQGLQKQAQVQKEILASTAKDIDEESDKQDVESVNDLLRKVNEFIQKAENRKAILGEHASKWADIEREMIDLEEWIKRQEKKLRDEEEKPAALTKDESNEQLAVLQLMSPECVEKEHLLRKLHEEEQKLGLPSDPKLDSYDEQLTALKRNLEHLQQAKYAHHQCVEEYSDAQRDCKEQLNDLDKDLKALLTNETLSTEEKLESLKRFAKERHKRSASLGVLEDKSQALARTASPEGRLSLQEDLSTSQAHWNDYQQRLNAYISKIEEIVTDFRSLTRKCQEL